MGKALRALSCSFWGGHQTYAHYSGHSAIKAVLCHCQNNCNRCQKITALVKSTPKAPAQGLIQAPEANEHPSPDVNCFQTVFLTHFQCNVGGEGGGKQIRLPGGDPPISPLRLWTDANVAQPPKHTRKVTDILYAQQ